MDRLGQYNKNDYIGLYVYYTYILAVHKIFNYKCIHLDFL